jgi:hypothetical protein
LLGNFVDEMNIFAATFMQLYFALEFGLIFREEFELKDLTTVISIANKDDLA